jgi:hypothetical protein
MADSIAGAERALQDERAMRDPVARRGPAGLCLALKTFSPRWRCKAIEDVRWIRSASSRIVFAARYMLLTPKH